jgi:hypothetical protein
MLLISLLHCSIPSFGGVMVVIKRAKEREGHTGKKYPILTVTNWCVANTRENIFFNYLLK